MSIHLDDVVDWKASIDVTGIFRQPVDNDEWDWCRDCRVKCKGRTVGNPPLDAVGEAFFMAPNLGTGETTVQIALDEPFVCVDCCLVGYDELDRAVDCTIGEGRGYLGNGVYASWFVSVYAPDNDYFGSSLANLPPAHLVLIFDTPAAD